MNLADPSILAAVHQRATQARNPYQTDFYRFLTELCWTKDEARAGKVARIPLYPYIREVCDALITCPMLFIEKSRRVLASWICSAFDLWIASGGQDARWPTLMLSTSNRQCIVAARKLKDLAGSAWFVNERIQFIADQFEEQGCRDAWPEFPRWTWTVGKGRASNGGHIDAVAQGADQMPGTGATLLRCEELAFWSQAEASVMRAKAILQGGGHIVAVTTANAGTFAKKIVMGEIGKGHWNE